MKPGPEQPGGRRGAQAVRPGLLAPLLSVTAHLSPIHFQQSSTAWSYPHVKLQQGSKVKQKELLANVCSPAALHVHSKTQRSFPGTTVHPTQQLCEAPAVTAGQQAAPAGLSLAFCSHQRLCGNFTCREI